MRRSVLFVAGAIDSHGVASPSLFFVAGTTLWKRRVERFVWFELVGVGGCKVGSAA